MLIDSYPTATQQTSSDRISGLNELVLSNSRELSFILPSLAYLTNQFSDRWLTWISKNHSADRQILQHYGFNLNRMRIIQPKSSEHAYWLFWEALTKGNSHTVVGTLTHIDDKQIDLLEKAAHQGNCVAMLLRERNQTPH